MLAHSLVANMPAIQLPARRLETFRYSRFPSLWLQESAHSCRILSTNAADLVHVVKGANYMSLYDVPKYVDEAVSVLAPFFRSNLALDREKSVVISRHDHAGANAFDLITVRDPLPPGLPIASARSARTRGRP